MTDRIDMRLHSDERGLAGASLVIVIAWALAAVLMLTGTLVAAQQIDERVFEITNLVTDIDEDTTHVALTQDINESAAAILDAAAPLSGQLDQVVESASSIDGTVDEILATAQNIGQVVVPIGTSVGGIGGSATSIGSNVDSIHSSFEGILANVQPINTNVAEINQKAAHIIGQVDGIKADTGQVVREVGREDVPSILGHAASIDCNSIVVVLGLLSGSGCV